MDDSESCLQNAKILIEITRTWPQLSVTTIALYLLKIKISNNQNVLINIVKNFYELAINKVKLNILQIIQKLNIKIQTYLRMI